MTLQVVDLSCSSDEDEEPEGSPEQQGGDSMADAEDALHDVPDMGMLNDSEASEDRFSPPPHSPRPRSPQRRRLVSAV